MRLQTLEEALLAKNIFLEIAAVEGLWVACLAGPRGRIIVPAVSHGAFEGVIREFDNTLGDAVRSVPARRLDTTALKILMGLEALIEVRSRKEGSFAIKIWAPKETLQDLTLHFRTTTPWRALNEAVATTLATISAMHLARTIGH